MILYDANADRAFTLQDLKRDYIEFRADDPENADPSFSRYLFNVIDATNRGRNDCEIIGKTPREIGKLQSYLACRIRFDDM